jgi:hypothetical protein
MIAEQNSPYPPIVRRNMQPYGRSARRLSPDSHFPRMTSDSCNVLLNPLQRQPLVAQAKIRISRGDRVVIVTLEKALGSKAVVECYSDHWSAIGEGLLDHEGKIAAQVDSASLDETAAVDPYCYWEAQYYNAFCAH